VAIRCGPAAAGLIGFVVGWTRNCRRPATRPMSAICASWSG
jgi:hypothetical protein